MIKKEIICILCPNGCRIALAVEGNDVSVGEGARCRRGEEYAVREAVAPVRTLTTTVRVRGGLLPVLPVRTSCPVPREKVKECAFLLAEIEVTAPVRFGQVIMPDILGTGADIIALRDMGGQALKKTLLAGSLPPQPVKGEQRGQYREKGEAGEDDS